MGIIMCEALLIAYDTEGKKTVDVVPNDSIYTKGDYYSTSQVLGPWALSFSLPWKLLGPLSSEGQKIKVWLDRRVLIRSSNCMLRINLPKVKKADTVSVDKKH